MMGRKVVFVIVTLLLASCGGYTLVNGGAETKIGDVMASTPLKDWSKTKDGNVDVWTLDGPLLQQIIFVKGIKDGNYMIPIRKARSYALEDDIPKFEKSMTSIEVVELFESTIKRMKAQETEITNVRPYKTSHTAGFRFEFNFLTENGLSKTGSSYVVLEDERLYMAIYIGAELHYYEKGINDFEKIISSLRIL
jgi:hypothetical protein